MKASHVDTIYKENCLSIKGKRLPSKLLSISVDWIIPSSTKGSVALPRPWGACLSLGLDSAQICSFESIYKATTIKKMDPFPWGSQGVVSLCLHSKMCCFQVLTGGLWWYALGQIQCVHASRGPWGRTARWPYSCDLWCHRPKFPNSICKDDLATCFSIPNLKAQFYQYTHFFTRTHIVKFC